MNFAQKDTVMTPMYAEAFPPVRDFEPTRPLSIRMRMTDS